jgi:TfoX/Sxy family transcriptional regulator of competence genes
MEEISSKKMFGEYGVYMKEKMVAVICDNKFFVKPTEAGKQFLEHWKEDSPYPGAKPYILLEDEIENPDLLSDLIKITYDNLPQPKKRKK